MAESTDYSEFGPADAMAHVEANRQAAYHERDQLVAFITRVYPSHLKQHPADDPTWEAEWRTIVCVHSPAGQLTWHIHVSEGEMFGHLNVAPDPFADCVWDGHTTDQKYRRLSHLPPPQMELP